MDLNSYPLPLPLPIVTSEYDDQNQELHPFVPNNQASSSSSSSCVIFDTIQDQTGGYQHQLCPLQQDHNHAYNGGSSMTYEVEWKNEDLGDVPPEIRWKHGTYPVKLVSSKMRLTQKMKKNHDGLGLKLTSLSTTKRSYLGTDSSIISSSHDNIPIRVCSDCNTTKTPLWRSGPKGPKSLCNACGIKQRKARMAADDKKGALANMNMQHEDKAAGGNPKASHGRKKLGNFEDLLMKLSKNLTFHRVFPEDEMYAAILLMALSSGQLHN